MRRTPAGLLLVLLCLPAWPASGQQDAPRATVGADMLRNDRSSFLVRCEVNHATGSYREGDALSVKIACEVEAYIYVLYLQADGKTVQIFPNRIQPENRIPARQTLRIPAREDLFRWTIGPPFGKETLKVIAARQPLDPLSERGRNERGRNEQGRNEQGRNEQGRNERGSNQQGRNEQGGGGALFPPVDGETLKGIDLVLGERSPADWEEDSVDLYTYPRDLAVIDPAARRVGVFFGVAHYEFNAEYEQAQLDAGTPPDAVRPLNLPSSHNNAKRLAELLQEVGQLDELRVFTNEQATRERMKEMLTSWLPDRTRPGDTVIFFYSGHGIQIQDDSGDEADGFDEVLNPHDQVTGDILLQLAKKKDQLDASQASRLEMLRRRFLEVYRRTNSAGQASDAVIRASGVSDDEFGQWLQHLDGRRVAIVLNGCHTGGFANNEKGAERGDRGRTFDFLDGEISRLKDIGQRHCSLLTACTASQSSLVHRDREFSVLPYFLIELLRKTDEGPVSMARAHAYCAARMEQYFRELEARTPGSVVPHQPQFYADRDDPIYLKP